MLIMQMVKISLSFALFVLLFNPLDGFLKTLEAQMRWISFFKLCEPLQRRVMSKFCSICCPDFVLLVTDVIIIISCSIINISICEVVN